MNELTWRSKVAAPVLTSVILLVMWELAADFKLVPPYILPAPSAILIRIIEMWPELLGHSIVTGVEIILGFVLAVVVGATLAIIIVYYPPFEATVAPWIVVSQVIPKVALGPLFVIWLGFGVLPKVVIAFLIAFFPILIDTIVGLRSVERDSIFLLKAMGASRWKIARHLLFPNALPNVFAGMKVAITLATVGAIVGEFVGANEGLGYVILFANGTMDTLLLFSALVVLSVLAFVLYAIIGVLQNIFVSWHVSHRVGSNSVTM
jgi:NitT/TauT family transport system permease protein